MPGNRDRYEQAMNDGHSAAWDQEWQRAASAYTKAIQEFPEDPEAHIHLGLALLNAGRLEDALKVYKRAHNLTPDDPIPLEKSADVLERMGRLKEAAQQYINVSDVYLAQRDLDKAIGNWERATQLTPGLIPIHAKLAQAYERVGDNKKALHQYLVLAFNFRRQNDVDRAIKAVERALRLDPKSPQALNTLRALQSGAEVVLIEEEEVAPPPSSLQKPGGGKQSGASKQSPPKSPFDLEDDDEKSPGDADPLGPLGEAMQEAMGLLAAYVIESADMDAIGNAMQAMELQRQGMIAEAIAPYQRAEVKTRHPALKMNLGGLLVLNDKPDEAVKHLGEAIMEPALAPGAFHALGLAYAKLSKHKLAAKNLIRSLQLVDEATVMNPEEAAELSSVYERLQKTLGDRGDEQLAPINERFLKLLSGNDWKQRIAETRRHMESIMSGEGEQGVVDFLGATGADKLTESVSAIDRFMRQGMLITAMDEAHYVVQFSPTYLPVHVRMAEIMMREGRVRQAINKYNTIARLYMVRGENDRAAAILAEVLEMAPLDVPVRLNLIELLEGENRMPEALDQHIALANTYQQLGNMDQSRETFGVAERMAKRMNAPVEKIVLIKHAMADIDSMRLDTRKAQKLLEEIVELMPTDERAQKALVELYFTQNNHLEAIRRLDVLLGVYAKNKAAAKIVSTLEEMVKRYPKDTGLRSRMAAIYQQMGRKKDAVLQLDELASLQLDAGMQKEGVATLKRIIGLNPDNVDNYKRLLAQLGGG